MKAPGGVASSSDVAGEVRIRGNHLLIVNAGAQTAYIAIIQIQSSGETVTTSDFPLESGDELLVDGLLIQSFKHICAAGQSTSLRYLGWK